MASRYVPALREAQPSGPYLLGGWSLGGSIAFEMARQLTARGERVSSLILIDSPAPGGNVPPPDESRLLAAFASDLIRVLGPSQASGPTPDAPESFEEVAALAPHLAPDHLRVHYRTFRANVLARANYRPGPYAGRALVIRAADANSAADPTLGWSALVAGEVATHALPGDHYSVMREPAVRELAAMIDSEIEACP
jgi:thioesterase domain-containing protein